jgi:2-dehydropantoate 2-reductase
MGAFLARAGHEVTLVDTVADHVAAINRSGLSITGPIDEFSTRMPAFTPDTLSGTSARS